MGEIVITSLAERPEYRPELKTFRGGWPKFMQQDPTGTR